MDAHLPLTLNCVRGILLYIKKHLKGANMKYKTTIELEAVQFTGDLTKMPDWFLNRCSIGKSNGEWCVYDSLFKEEVNIRIGNFILDNAFDVVEILDAETFNKNYTAITAEGGEHA